MHHKYLGGKNGELNSAFLKNLPILALQRLARLGAILPQQLGIEALKIAKTPISLKAGAQNSNQSEVQSREVEEFIDSVCNDYGVNPRYRSVVSARMRRALFIDL
jgi:hypothetical protein